MIRNVIFDWSGTLVDDLPMVLEATNHVFRQAGIPELTLAQFRSEFSLPFTRFYDRFTPHVPLPQLEQWFHSYYEQIRDRVEELPYARAFLQFCQRLELRTFILSTVREDHFLIQARRTGLEPYLGRAYLGVWDKRAKIGQILLENHLRPDQTLFVGDMQHDIEAAKHGEVLSCAVLTGYNNLEQLRGAQPDLLVEHLGELQQTLERNRLEVVAQGSGSADNPWPVVTVGALIFDDRQQVLMIRTHKWSDLWGIPGGKIRFGEPAVEALRREIMEETNLNVRDIEFVLVQDCIHSQEFYRDAHFVLLNYLCRAENPAEVRLNEEALEFQWVPGQEALAMALNRPTRFLLETVGERVLARPLEQRPRPGQGEPAPCPRPV